ncbi:MAG: DapH/DapD/GlmU-related protein [Candidatus Thorarchaeota archaeon]
MKPRTVAYSIYMILSIMISLSVSTIPSLVLILIAFQRTDTIVTEIIPPLSIVPMSLHSLAGDLLPALFYEKFWFIVMLIPVVMVAYGVFLALLAVMFRLSRRLVPNLPDGYYPKHTEDWLIYEYFEVYYILFERFASFFSVFLNTRPRHMLFGAKIGKNTIVGNGRLFNPERTIIGENCFFGYNAILSGHVYEGDRLYLRTVRLGNNVTVGANAVVLPGADIGDNVIIAANSTVPKDRVIPPNSIWIHGKSIPRDSSSKTDTSAHSGLEGPFDDAGSR